MQPYNSKKKTYLKANIYLVALYFKTHLLSCTESKTKFFYITAQCLQTVTEENKELIALCRLPDKASLLESIIADDALSSQHALLKTLVVGKVID